MIRKHYHKTKDLIERRRFQLLLLSTLLVLVLPAFSGSGILSEILFILTMSFLFIQSMIAAKIKRTRRRLIHYVVLILIIMTSLEPVGFKSIYLDLMKVIAFVTFFVFVVIHLFRFIAGSHKVTPNVLITSVNIYLLIGIIGAFLAFFFNRLYADAYSFPANIKVPVLVNFLYYSFITMSTVGYGDIVPRIPETQTLAYLISVTGQLYIAIIIAFLVGKLLVGADKK